MDITDPSMERYAEISRERIRELALERDQLRSERDELRAALQVFGDCWEPYLAHYDQRGTPGWSAMGRVRIADLKRAHDLCGSSGDASEAVPLREIVARGSIGPDYHYPVYAGGTLKGWIGASKTGPLWHVAWPDRSNGGLAQGWDSLGAAVSYMEQIVVPEERRG